MKASKFSNIIEGDLKVVEKKKIWFSIPAAVIALALIMIIIFAFAADSALNLGIDFAGGYAVTVKFTALTDENYDEYVEKIDKIVSGLSDEQDKNYGLKVSKYRRLGSDGSDSAIYINYKNIKGYSEEQMEEVSERLEEELNNLIIRIIPEVAVTSGKAVLSYDRTMSAYRANIETQLQNAFPNAALNWLDPAPSEVNDNDSELMYFTQLELAAAGTLTEDAVKEAAAIPDSYSGTISPSAIISGSVSSDFINYALSAFIVAVVVMFICILLRFRSLSVGVSSIAVILLNLIMMFCFMSIFHIEITVTFIAALLTVLCFSVNNVIIVFNRIAENRKKVTPDMTISSLINNSVKETLIRSIITTSAAFVVIGIIGLVCAIVGIFDMVTFALPVMFGFIASAFSSLFIAPSIWSVMNKELIKHKTATKTKKKEPTTI